MRFLDFVEQDHGVRVFGDRIGEQSTLVEADITRRGADQSRYGVPLHVLGHIEANQFQPQNRRQLAGDFGLTDPGGAGEQKRADGLVATAQTGAGHLDRRGQLRHRFVLAEHDQLEVALQLLQHLFVIAVHGLGRNARDLGHHRLHIVLAHDFLAP